MTIVRVGLDVPVNKLFDYRCDAEIAIGMRVLVPFGKRTMVGVALELASSSDLPPEQLKSVSRILRDAPPLSADDLKLLRFAADYYHHPLGAAVLGALPVLLRRVNKGTGARFMHYHLTKAGAVADIASLPRSAITKRLVLKRLQEEQAMGREAARSMAATAPAALKHFTECGWIELRPGAAPASVVPEVTSSFNEKMPTLTPEQASAVERIRVKLHGFHPALLFGVTGSGKTEVYLRVIELVLKAGRQALMLVPEIALTPQLETMVRARFPNIALVSLHSGLNESERLRHWLFAQSGEAHIVLGTRLAIYAPMPKLGIIIVDEEHDASLKQGEGFRYSARDLAAVRARQAGVPVIFGSATPALETWHNATSGRYELIEIQYRVTGPMPHISCVSTRGVKLDGGLAPTVILALEERLQRGEQSLVFINRRGYAPVLMCHDCGWLSGCHRCSAKLVYHLHDRQLHCHHCGYQAGTPAACPDCGNAALSAVGQGTQRIEEALAARFPSARILRIDRDSTRKRGSWSSMRKRIAAREIDILIGTQILAKGHDFPHLSLVCVVNADSLLYSTDFRAPERLYALLTQVAGRAGRGAQRGNVLIQTEFPYHAIYAALRDQDYRRFAEVLLKERLAAKLPPFTYQALLRAETTKLEAAIDWLTRAICVSDKSISEVAVYEPVPSSLLRLAGRERAQLMVEAVSRSALKAFLGDWCARLAKEKRSTVRWTLDVDPLDI